jgi:hypothetical protein
MNAAQPEVENQVALRLFPARLVVALYATVENTDEKRLDKPADGAVTPLFTRDGQAEARFEDDGESRPADGDEADAPKGETREIHGFSFHEHDKGESSKVKEAGNFFPASRELQSVT